jgi:hypothetical protein
MVVQPLHLFVQAILLLIRNSEEPSHGGVTIPYISRRGNGTNKIFVVVNFTLLACLYQKFAKKVTINYLAIRNNSTVAKDTFKKIDVGEFN